MAIVLTAGLGYLDYATGPDLSLALLYVLPVTLVTWRFGATTGIALAVLCGAIWIADRAVSPQSPLHPAVSYANIAGRLCFLLVLSLLVGALRSATLREQTLARTDGLTRCTNWREFREQAGTEIDRSRRYSHALSVAYLDLDNFKLVNDQLGHTTGDRLLQVVGETARRHVRSVDVVARLGGDEFAILFPETDADAAEAAVRNLHAALLQSMGQNGWPVTLALES